jgi:hypothetical protein
MTSRPFSLLLVLAIAAPVSAQVWSVDELETDSNVPAKISAAWTANQGTPAGKEWDKYYFQDEFGAQRTVWCRHADCDSVLKSGDAGKRVALYYLAAAGAPGAWKAILSAYDIHWEPSKSGGLRDVISRAGTPLAITPSRPWKSDDSMNLPGTDMVLAPASREVPPQSAVLVEAKDWPACQNLDANGPASGLRKLQPMEIELKEAAAQSDEPEQLRAFFAGLTAEGALKVRSEALALAAKESKAAAAPKDRFDSVEARFLYCRIKRYDQFQSFRKEMQQDKDPSAFVAKWRRFVRGELAVYQREASAASSNRKASLVSLEQRTITALGATPYVAGRQTVGPHTEEMRQAGERVDAMLDELR